MERPTRASLRLSSAHDKARVRRTADQIDQLECQIMDVLRQDHPQSIRHVFYRMTDPRLPVSVEKSAHGYNQVQHRMTKMRRAGLLPYDWITDMTRRGYHVQTYDSPEEFVRETAHLYRRNLWEQANHYVEVWCESRSIAGVIEDDCEDLAVSLYPAGGFSSLTLTYQGAEYISQAAGGRPVEIIYIGDYDPAGVLIDDAIERELREHLDPSIILNFHRIAITKAQIRRYDLPTKPRKAGDRRALHITEAVEAEAMPANIMRRLLRSTIESFLPTDAYRITKIAEDSERELLEAFSFASARYGQHPQEKSA